MNRTIYEIVGFATTSIGAVFGILGVYLGIKDSPNIAYINWASIITTILFLTLFIIFLIRSQRNRRYKKAYVTINRAFSIINELFEDEIKLTDLPVCIRHFEEFCTHISETFNLITNVECFTCIKLFEQTENNDVAVVTFCRDSASRNSSMRINPENDSTIHYLRDNSDFFYIFENLDNENDQNKYFFSNALPFLDFYSNTRLNKTKYPPNYSFPVIKEFMRWLSWPLPYRSTITVPITLFSNRRINEGRIAGFLCVDSPRMFTFNKTHDTQILRGVADGVYSAVRKINEVHFNSIHKNIKLAPKTKNQ